MDEYTSAEASSSNPNSQPLNSGFLALLTDKDDLVFETSQFEMPAFEEPSLLEPLMEEDMTMDEGVLEEGYKGNSNLRLDEYEDEDNETYDDETDEDEEFLNEDDEFERWMQAAQATGGDVSTMTPLPNWDLSAFADDIAEFDDTVRESSGVGKKRRGRKPRGEGASSIREPKLPPDITALLSEANMNYVNREYAEAIEKYQDVIRRNPNVHIAWVNLGMIHEELGNKEKAVQLALVAAHLRPKDGEAWRRLGMKSTDLGAIRQAIYCYSKAIQADPSDVDAIWDRSFLYKQVGRFSHATAGFTKLLELAPYNMLVVGELAKLYREIGQVDKAIKYYEDAMAYYFKIPLSESVSHFGYTELNILSELYMMANNYERVLEIIKVGVRRLQGRENEVWWDENVEFGEEDREYLEEDANDDAAISETSRLDIPMELRVRMGIARVMMGQIEEGKAHFKFLYDQAVAAYPDLYQEVAETFMDKNHYSDALAVFDRINSGEDGVAPEILIQLGDCHRQLGNLDQAAEYYSFVVSENPGNKDVKMALAQVYEELGEEEMAFELVSEVVKANKEEKRKKRVLYEASRSQHEEELLDPQPKASFFDENIGEINGSKRAERYDKIRAAARASAAENRAREEAEREKENLAKFEQIRILERRMETAVSEKTSQDRKRATWEYIRLAEEVFTDFRSTKEFYPADRMKIFTGFRRRGGKRREGRSLEQAAEEKEQEEQVRRMATRLRGRLQGNDGIQNDNKEDGYHGSEEDEAPVEETRTNATSFRGVNFDSWFMVIVKFAMLLAFSNRHQEAYDVLKSAGDANVFYHNPKRRIALKIVMMACALVNHDYEVVCEMARWLCTCKPLRNEVYRIYGMAMCSGTAALSQFANSNALKYFLRQIKAMDLAVDVSNKDHSNNNVASSLLAGDMDLDGDPTQPVLTQKEIRMINSVSLGNNKPQLSHSLLTLYGHSLNCARSYLGAIGYYLRAYAIKPRDPLISLCLGLSYLHRAMQRHTDNRHLQIIQGFAFIFKYTELRGQTQEAEFNLGRAFHHLGLYDLAVPHYQKVFEMPSLKQMTRGAEEMEIDDEEEDETDLKREAAYNLSLIYLASGSMGLAQVVLTKYCTI